MRGVLTVAALVGLLARVGPAAAVVTDGLIHDTPRVREALREQTGGSLVPSKEGAAPAAASSDGEFEQIWFAREKYLQIGEHEKAEQQLMTLWERALARGVRNLPEVGAVLVREAERRIRSRDWDQAAAALLWARRLSPDAPSVYAARAMLALRRNPLNPVPVWSEVAAWWRAVGGSFRLQAWLRANLLGTLLSGLTLFFVVAIVILSVTAAGRLVHDLREGINVGSLKARTALAWAALAAPALLGFSPWWWVICAGLLLWPYFTKPARGLTLAGALFLLALPLAVRERALLLTVSERPLLAAVAQVREGNWTAADHATLKAETGAGAGLPAVIALGVAARHLGELDAAEAAFRAGLQAAPNSAALWVNLGNVAFARQDHATAAANYVKAAELDPRAFAPHFNLGILYRDTFKFDESGAAMKRAGEVDPAASEFFSGLDPARLKGFSIDGLPSTADLWSLARVRDEAQELAVSDLWDSLMLGPSSGAWPAVVAGLLLLGGGLGAWRLKRGTAASCARCGRVFCARCQPGRSGELCSQCHHIFVKKEGVDARARVQKMGEIKSRRRRLRLRDLTFAALVPGGGCLSAGRFWSGLGLLLPACFLEARGLIGWGAFPSPWSLGGGSASSFGWLGVAAFAALWLASFWMTWSFEE